MDATVTTHRAADRAAMRLLAALDRAAAVQREVERARRALELAANRGLRVVAEEIVAADEDEITT